MIFSSEYIMIFLTFSIFLIFSKYPSLLAFLIHAYLTQTAQVPKLLDGAKFLTKILTLCVYRAQQRHR